MNTPMPRAVATMAAEQQADFILKTYAHLVGGIVAFVLFEIWLFQSNGAAAIMQMMQGASWLLILGAFMVVNWLATMAAHRIQSTAGQYLAFAVLIAAWGVMFVPMVFYAMINAPGAVDKAIIATMVGFSVLTAIVFKTRKNFSFLRPMMTFGGIAAIGTIVWAVLSGSSLGLWFSAAMIVYAGGAVLYSTSAVLHEYGPGQHVAASMQLFGAIALMFWYILRLFSSD